MGAGTEEDRKKQRDAGSRLDQLYSDGSGSKLDQLYGSPQKNDATKAAEAERRVDQRMYRDAVRNKDYRAVAEFHSRPGFQAVSGITRHGQFDAQDRQTGENFTQEGRRLYNNGQGGNQSANEIERAASKPRGTGDGSTPENAAGGLKEGSTGGYWVNVGPSATTTTETPSGGAVAPATDKPADWRKKRQAALDKVRNEIASQTDPSAKVSEIDPKYAVSSEQAKEMDAAGISGEADKSGRAPRANAEFAKQYGDYLNSEEGKNASREQKDAKYAELKKANPDFEVTDEGRAAAAPIIAKAEADAKNLPPMNDVESVRYLNDALDGNNPLLSKLETLISRGKGGIGNNVEGTLGGLIPEDSGTAGSELDRQGLKPSGDLFSRSEIDSNNLFNQNKPDANQFFSIIEKGRRRDEAIAAADDIFAGLPSNTPSKQPEIKSESNSDQKTNKEYKPDNGLPSNSITGLGIDILNAGKSVLNYGKDFVKSFVETPDRAVIAANYAASADRFDLEAKELREEIDQIKGESNYSKGKKRELQTKLHIVEGRASHYRSYSEKIRTNDFGKKEPPVVTIPPTTAKVDKEREAASMWG